MTQLQKAGGAAALLDSLTYIIGFAIAFTFILPMEGLEASQKVAFLVENHLLMHLWHLLIYVVNGLGLVVLVLALYERLKAGSPAVALTAAAFGLIWCATVLMSGMLILNDLRLLSTLYPQDPTQAVVLWQTLSAVESGLGGAVELPGGMWILLVSIAALQADELSKPLNYLGLLIGLAGIATTIPGLHEAGSLFGLGFILWFAWAGVLLLRQTPRPAVYPSPHYSPTSI